MEKKKDIIKFGYGNIVPQPHWDCITFLKFTPNVEVGQHMPSDAEIINSIDMKLSLGDAFKLEGKLKKLKFQDDKTIDDKTIDFNDCILDFTNYNPKSVNIVLKALWYFTKRHLRCFAA